MSAGASVSVLHNLCADLQRVTRTEFRKETETPKSTQPKNELFDSSIVSRPPGERRRRQLGAAPAARRGRSGGGARARAHAPPPGPTQLRVQYATVSGWMVSVPEEPQSVAHAVT